MRRHDVRILITGLVPLNEETAQSLVGFFPLPPPECAHVVKSHEYKARLSYKSSAEASKEVPLHFAFPNFQNGKKYFFFCLFKVSRLLYFVMAARGSNIEAKRYIKNKLQNLLPSPALRCLCWFCLVLRALVFY